MLAIVFLSFVLSHAEALICPDGWTSTWLNQCYLMSPNKMNWFQAQEFCWGQNGFLAEVKTRDQQSSLYFLPSELNFWIGLNDIENEGKFVWAEGHEEMNFSNWIPGQPNNSGGEEDCVHMAGSLDYGKWNDAPCTNVDGWGMLPLHALCQK